MRVAASATRPNSVRATDCEVKPSTNGKPLTITPIAVLASVVRTEFHASRPYGASSTVRWAVRFRAKSQMTDGVTKNGNATAHANATGPAPDKRAAHTAENRTRASSVVIQKIAVQNRRP